MDKYDLSIVVEIARQTRRWIYDAKPDWSLWYCK